MSAAFWAWWVGRPLGERLALIYVAAVLGILTSSIVGLVLFVGTRAFVVESRGQVGAAPTPAPERKPPTLSDFWEGQAYWQLDVADVGLPMGESDTLVGPDGQLWSYLHASYQSAGIRDHQGAPVPFPGCVTLWKSADAGRHFTLTEPTCLIPCTGTPCDSVRDHVDQQQYPRVARDPSGGFTMVYEWRGWNFLRTSPDGLRWSDARHIPDTRQWDTWYAPCHPTEAIGRHPFVPPDRDYECSIGGPPGLYIDGGTLYVFVGLGKNPGRMGCYVGVAKDGADGLRRCATRALFSGAETYGPHGAKGADANPYFDFRTVSSADVVKVGDRYYMAYEGVRGPSGAAAGDDQFNLGFARSVGPRIDGPWEKYPANPVLTDVPGNVGVGHADLLMLDGTTYLYTATSAATRGRYALVWAQSSGSR